MRISMESEDLKQDFSSTGAQESQQADEIKKYKEQAEKAALMCAYLSADFDNYKKRIEKERAQWMDQAAEDVLIHILPIRDDIDRGLVETGSEQQPGLHSKGLELIAKGFSKVLAQYNVEEIPLKQEFDPHLFEAIMSVPSEQHTSGEVIAILRKGYMRKGKVLRPAEVSVAL